MNPTLISVTDRIRARSEKSRGDYLNRLERAAEAGPARRKLSCSNLAHGLAASETADKQALMLESTANIAIVSSYNDMLSAHQPFETFPALIRKAAHEAGAVAQFCGGRSGHV